MANDNPSPFRLGPVDTFRSQIGRSLGRALPTVIAFLPESAFTRLLSSACASIRPSSVPPPPPPKPAADPSRIS